MIKNGIISTLIIFLTIALVVYFITKKNKKENFNNNDIINVSPSSGLGSLSKFKKIGKGFAIDDKSMKSWNSGGIGGFKFIKNANGENVAISTSHYRNIVGFIPPSFTFYPFGRVNTDYKIFNKDKEKNDEGTKICMQKCIDTGCKAVQTEVPELCSSEHFTDPDGVEKHLCGFNSEAGCTLFYDTIDNADDAYYNIYQKSKFSSRNDYLGQKYYVFEKIPSISPQNDKKPSESPMKWCSSNQKLDNAVNGRIPSVDEIIEIQSGKINNDCKDGNNCCIYRDYSTSNGIKNKYPVYNLPVDRYKYEQTKRVDSTVICTLDVTDKTGSEEKKSSCGAVNGEFISCPTSKINTNNSLIFWDDPKMPDSCDKSYGKCGGDQGIVLCSSGQDSIKCDDGKTVSCSKENIFDRAACLTKSLAALVKKDKAKAINELNNCCEYKKDRCIIMGIQPDCFGNDEVIRGCYGNPPIINTDSIGDQGIKACSSYDNCSTSPDDPNKCNSDGFYYTCEDGGDLWVPV